MPLVPFHELMSAAERGQYAVGYFESWNLESLLAVADAAEKLRSPVILGFSGINLPHPERTTRERLAIYSAMALEVCRGLSVPCCLLFNESPFMDAVDEAVKVGFNLVMFSDDSLAELERQEAVRGLVERAHKHGVAVEAELEGLTGISGDLSADASAAAPLTDPAAAREFIQQTGIDALAVDVGQIHVHGRRVIRLNLDILAQLRDLSVPLVLHGATSVARDDLRAAVRLGVRKFNVGSMLKQAYFNALRGGCAAIREPYNPYDIIGSGFKSDVLQVARLAVQTAVEEMMHVFGSAGVC